MICFFRMIGCEITLGTVLVLYSFLIRFDNQRKVQQVWQKVDKTPHLVHRRNTLCVIFWWMMTFVERVVLLIYSSYCQWDQAISGNLTGLWVRGVGDTTGRSISSKLKTKVGFWREGETMAMSECGSKFSIVALRNESIEILLFLWHGFSSKSSSNEIIDLFFKNEIPEESWSSLRGESCSWDSLLETKLLLDFPITLRRVFKVVSASSDCLSEDGNKIRSIRIFHLITMDGIHVLPYTIIIWSTDWNGI